MSEQLKQTRGGVLDEMRKIVSSVEAMFVFPKGRGRLERPRFPRKIAGVCSGLAEHFGWNAAFLRILFVVLALCSSGGLVLGYLAAWVLIPEGSYELTERAGMTAS